MDDVNGLNIPVNLSPRELRFVQEYPACNYNGREAAIRAGYSPKTAAQAASRVLKKVRPLVEARQQAEERRLAELSNTPSPRTQQVAAIATLEQSLKMVTALAFYDPRKLYEGDNLKKQSDLTRREALMVTGFEVEENFVGVGGKAAHVGYTKKVKLVDRAPYLNMLLKWHRAFPTGGTQPTTPPPGPAFNTATWTSEDWEAFKRLYQKSQQANTVIDGQSSGT